MSIGREKANRKKSTAAFDYNSATPMYGTLASWEPLGYPFSVSFVHEDRDANTNNVALNGGDFSLLALFTNGVALYDKASDETQQSIDSGATWTADKTQYTFSGDGDGCSFSVGGSTVSNTVPFKILGDNVISTVQSGAAGASAIGGKMSKLRLIDGSPIQGGTYQVLNNNIRSNLNAGIPVVDDFELEFNWVRTNHPTGDNQLLLSADNATAHLFTFNINDTDAASTPNRIQVGMDGTFATWNGALDGVEVGQHIHIKLTRVSGTAELFIDGVSKGTAALEKHTYIDRVGANHNGGVRANGAMGDFKVTLQSTGSQTGFLVYGEEHQDILDTFSATSSSDMGTLTLENQGDMLWDATKGWKCPQISVGSAVTGYWGDTVAGFDCIANGFRLSFEVEKEFFDNVYAASSSHYNLMALHNSGDITQSVYVARMEGASGSGGFGALRNPTSPTTSPEVKTDSTSYGDTHVRVDISYDPAASTNGTIDVYVEKQHVLSWDINATVAATDQIRLVSFNGGFLFDGGNCEQYIRNVILAKYPLRQHGTTKRRVAVIGDSFPQWCQYQMGNQDGGDANNQPPIDGVYEANGTYDGKTDSLQESGFQRLHQRLREKNVIPTAPVGQGSNQTTERVESYARGGSTIYNIGSTDTLDERTDAALGLNLELPAGGTTDHDWVVFCSGGNDVSAFFNNIGTAFEQTQSEFLSDIDTNFKSAIDKMIDTGGASWIGIVAQVHRKQSTAEFNNLIDVMNTNVLSQLDGYRGVCHYIPLPDWDKNTMTGTDNLHPNALGGTYIFEQVAQAMPSYSFEAGTFVFDYSMDEGSGTDMVNSNSVTGTDFNGVWTGTNWTAYPNRSRYYPMNEGSGSEHFDASEVGTTINKITIVGYLNDTNWQVSEKGSPSRMIGSNVIG